MLYFIVSLVCTILMCQSFENSKRGNHIDIQIHFLVLNNTIYIDYVSSSDRVADILLKPLCKDFLLNLEPI